jgi:hypothetical protein
VTIENILALPFIVVGIAAVLVFWGALGALIVSVVVAIFTASLATFGGLFGILVAVLAIIYLIGILYVL